MTGFIEKARILRNSSAKPGDVLILTKALGTGVLNTALKGDLISASTEKALYDSMRTLNKQAAEIMRVYDVHSCTDVTGFGLLGHAREMAIGSGLSIVYAGAVVPRFGKVNPDELGNRFFIFYDQYFAHIHAALYYLE